LWARHNKKGEKQMTLKLKDMTTEEKLQAMELLWDDICRNVPDFSSPAWHENILKEREKSLKNGKENFIDWDQAKKDIRDSIS
jgi:hypothetical protein